MAQKGTGRFVRNVKFIHKSAADFLKSRKEFIEISDAHPSGKLAVVRGQLAILNLAPHIVADPAELGQEKDGRSFEVSRAYIAALLGASYVETGYCQAMKDDAIHIVDEIYDSLCFLQSTLNGVNCTALGSANLVSLWAPGDLNDCYPFQGRLGFAAYFGRLDYVAEFIGRNVTSQDDIECIITSAIVGFGGLYLDKWLALTYRGRLDLLREFVPLSKDPYLVVSCKHEIGNIIQISKWAAFAAYSLSGIESDVKTRWKKQHSLLELVNPWTDLVKIFLLHDANVDRNILIRSMARGYAVSGMFCITLEETLAAYIERFTKLIPEGAAKQLLQEIVGILIAHGGIMSRKARAIGRDIPGLIRLAEDQSDRLLEGLFQEGEEWPSFHIANYRQDELAAPTPSQSVEAEALITRARSLLFDRGIESEEVV
ncbi:MAG: hypothetical protein Q9169_008412 [Polycauliona sp. 2 TL-2023]